MIFDQIHLRMPSSKEQQQQQQQQQQGERSNDRYGENEDIAIHLMFMHRSL
jgi:hypothetical protein